MKLIINSVIDRKLLKYLWLFYTLGFVVTSGSALIAKVQEIAYNNYTFNDLIVTLVVRYVAKLLFIYGGILLVRYLTVVHKLAGWIGFLIHCLFALVLTYYSIYTQVLLGNWFFGTDDPLNFNYIYDSAILGTDYNFFLYIYMITIVYAYYFFQKQKDYEVRQSDLKTQLLDAKINALQTQLQPHFLFNTLNDISSLVEYNPEKAQDALADLSELLRQTLRLKDIKFISLNDELELLQKYLDIEKIRYEDKLHFEIEVPKELRQTKIPPLLLQPIVENSIKHGFSLKNDQIKLVLVVKKDGDDVIINFINNGAPLKHKKVSFGIGIGNLISRLDTLYKGAFSFDIDDLPDRRGVITQIKLPFHN